MGDYQTILTFAGFLVLFVLLTLLLGRRERIRTRDKLVKKLRGDFGRMPSKNTPPERFAQIPQYYLHHTGRFQIDDITWNDLDMDRLFRTMDHTCSASGEEYLYYLLRTPALHGEDLPFTQDQYSWFAQDKNEGQRIRLQEILTRLGHAGRYSLYDYIDSTNVLGERSNRKHYIAAAAPFLAFGCMFISTGPGLVALLIVFAFNLRTYFKEKSVIAPYYQVFNYILRLLDCAQSLEKEGCPVFAEETAQIPGLTQAFSAFRRGSGILLGSAGGDSDPLGIILEYIRMLFHLDLIKFNNMLEHMRGRQKEIDALLTITGRIDACISIASWKETLPHSSVPVLHETAGLSNSQKRAVFHVNDLFHPLLTDPVSNSVDADRPVLLTGSNASGKSTFLKAAALCALLSQAVGISPAGQYEGAYYRIYTSMALRDSLQDGESYFIVEIKSLRRILEAADPNDNPVMCCIDEVLRGTNTVERIAASAEILRCFAQTGTLCFAATHDLELTGILSDVYDNYHFSEQIVDGDVRFSYRLLPGPSNSCNAIALLSSLGYDRTIVEKAQERADGYLQKGSWQ